MTHHPAGYKEFREMVLEMAKGAGKPAPSEEAILEGFNRSWDETERLLRERGLLPITPPALRWKSDEETK